MEPMTESCTTSYNKHDVGFEGCESAFLLANTILGGRDVIKEFVAAEVWPISDGWQLANIVFLDVDWSSQQVPFLGSIYD
jgi:hypothetical protein